MTKKAVLEVINLSKSFGAKRVVNDISLDVSEGDIYGFLGPNGAGKTTTIRMLLGLVHPDAGTVNINGHNLMHNFNDAINSVGALVETPAFHLSLSGHQNLALIKNLHPQIPEKRIHEVLEMVRLDNKANDQVKTYSLGMKQRLGIARTLLHYPKLVILDEPTNGLDPQGMKEVREMICQLSLEQDITFFISTHLLHEVEQTCNKVAILQEGDLIAQGSVKQLLAHNNEVVEIITDETDLAIDILRSAPFIKSIGKTSQGLSVELDRGFSASTNKMLVSRGIAVNYVIPKQQSFEQYFLDLTQGGESHV
ncbi:ABC transporter ATP-binding protein [Metallumcola ferriviriculae]|uniref:ABC transporter ATP-binding protein n=1 Tax=Metallumcola ferriviriculae TaxID=3039180 RepID=A0AAU0UW56_9FIRM|nr:ABC transporter ATP-binding protein [Desulfitibacteraceae bacterium MK1]